MQEGPPPPGARDSQDDDLAHRYAGLTRRIDKYSSDSPTRNSPPGQLCSFIIRLRRRGKVSAGAVHADVWAVRWPTFRFATSWCRAARRRCFYRACRRGPSFPFANLWWIAELDRVATAGV